MRLRGAVSLILPPNSQQSCPQRAPTSPPCLGGVCLASGDGLDSPSGAWACCLGQVFLAEFLQSRPQGVCFRPSDATHTSTSHPS